jgi:hypothetical protein
MGTKTPTLVDITTTDERRRDAAGNGGVSERYRVIAHSAMATSKHRYDRREALSFQVLISELRAPALEHVVQGVIRDANLEDSLEIFSAFAGNGGTKLVQRPPGPFVRG